MNREIRNVTRREAAFGGAHAARVWLSAARRKTFGPFFILVAFCLGLFGNAPLAWAAGDTLGIEKAQRDFQARYRLLKTTGRLPSDYPDYVTWPNCRGCGGGAPAPPYPKDGFYGDIVNDPEWGLSWSKTWRISWPTTHSWRIS